MALLVPVAWQVGLQLLLQPATSTAIAHGACTAVGVVYPAYASFKALESKAPAEEVNQLLTQWITYWATLGMLTAAESLTARRFPGYYHLKLAFLLWLQSSSFQGARRLYVGHARPVLLKHERTTDQWLAAFHKFMTRPELAWMGSHARKFAAGVPGLEWFVRPSPHGLEVSAATKHFFW